MTIRKLSAWSSYADNHAWKLLGAELKQKAIDALGKDRAVNVQFGNLLGWLRDCGEFDLAHEIKEAIDDYNAEALCPDCHADLKFDPISQRRCCPVHGFIDQEPPERPRITQRLVVPLLHYRSKQPGFMQRSGQISAPLRFLATLLFTLSGALTND